MTTWIVSGWIHFLIGLALGWIVFKQPAFVTAFIDKHKFW